MKKLLEKCNILPTREKTGDAPSIYEMLPVEEQHPRNTLTSKTVTPNGLPLRWWMSGGWNQHLWN